MAEEQIQYEDFARVDMRAGRIVEVEAFPRARTPSYKVVVDFGPQIGRRKSSLQAARDYRADELLDTLVVGVVNMPPKNIAGFQSEALILGVPAEDGSLSLLVPSCGAELGGRVY